MTDTEKLKEKKTVDGLQASACLLKIGEKYECLITI